MSTAVFELTPAILTDDPQFVQEQLDQFAQLQPRPMAVQIDLLDGEYADSLTIEPSKVHELETHGLMLDLHFMMVESANYLSELVGASNLRSVICQVERQSSLFEIADIVTHDLNLPLGFSLDWGTPLSAIEDELWPHVSILQLMTARAGEQGQEWHEGVLELIRDSVAHREERGLSYRIAVDIGMNSQTIPMVRTAGADIAAVGSYLHTDSSQERQKRWKVLHEVV